MIAAMHGGRNSLIAVGGGNSETDRQHDGVAVRHDGDAHRVLGVMAVRHIDVVGQRRSGERGTDPAHVHQVMRNAEPLRRRGREVELLAVALAVIEGHQPGELMLIGGDMSERHGIESARADDESFHVGPLFWCPGRLRPEWAPFSRTSGGWQSEGRGGLPALCSTRWMRPIYF